MAKLQIQAGATSQTVNVFIQNSSVSTGAGLTGLAYNTASLIAYYCFPAASDSQIVLATQTASGAWSSGGFCAVDGTNMPGLYRLDIPNAALASGNGRFVTIMLSGATNMAPCLLEIELTAINNQSTGFGLVDASANVVQWNGSNVSSPATAGIPDVNVKNYNNQTAATDGNNYPKVDVVDIAGNAVSTSSAQIGVNLVNISGSAVSTSSAQLGVNAVNIAGQAASLDGNNYLKVDVQDWFGTVVATPATAGIPDINVKNINNTTAATPGASGGILIAGTNAATTIDGLTLAGAAASGSTPAAAGLTITGGAASTTSGGTAAAAINATGGAGAASTNGAAAGVTFAAGGTTTVSGNDGMKVTATGNGNGLTAAHAGTGLDFNASTTNSLQANATQINGQSTSSVTTINANIGTTQAITFDANNYQKVDLVDIAGNAVSTSSAQIGVNLVNISGSAVSTSSAQLGVNAVNIAGQAASLDGNNYLKVDVVDIAGSAVSTSSAQLGVNAVNIGGHAAALDSNNFLKVDVADIAGTASAGTAGYVGIDWSAINAPTTTQGLSGTTVGTTTSVTGAVAITSNVKKDTALNDFEFIMYNSSGEPQTGLTVTATRSIDGNAFASCANSVIEIGNGAYTINLAASDLNGNNIMLQFTASSAATTFVSLVTQP